MVDLDKKDQADKTCGSRRTCMWDWRIAIADDEEREPNFHCCWHLKKRGPKLLFGRIGAVNLLRQSH